ncbi:MAG: hypothetical protein IKX84_04770 [Clostridia bacterium]|nr:hypothetical protein [Clostridia bacterium]
MTNDSWEKWDETALETSWRLEKLKQLSARIDREYSLIPARERKKGGLLKQLKLAALYIFGVFAGQY